MSLVLVTGSRELEDTEWVFMVLDKEHKEDRITFLLHGDADGLDSIAHQWALCAGVQPVACEASWGYYGKKAGPIRNNNMLIFKPDRAIVFPGGPGTKDMTNKLIAKNIKIIYAGIKYK